MDPFIVAAFVLVGFGLYRMIYVAVQVLKIVLFANYPSNAEELPRLPFIGHMYLFIGGTEAIFNRMINLAQIYPTKLQVWFGFRSISIISFPEHIKEILLSPKTIEKSYLYDFGRPWLGNALVTAPASIWEVHRKLLQPSFNFIVLRSFIETFATQSVILAKKMKQQLDGPEFEIYKYLSLCTLDTICATAMGISLKAQESQECQYDEASQKVMAGFALRAFRPWLYPDIVFYRTRLGKDQRKRIEFLQDVADNVIRQKKAEIVSRSNQRVRFDNSAARPQSLVENLLRSSNDNKTLTDEEVRNHVDSMIAAGADSTAITMNFMMLMLASNEDIQEKVYQELCDIFGVRVSGDDGGELHITMEVLAKMTYIDRVIKETMRLFPVTPGISRQATDDLYLGQCILPKGTIVALNIFGVHRSEKYWTDPLQFDPDRFLPERFARQEPYSYLPFSGGRRNCIGFKYAMMFMKTVTATILRKYVFTKNEVVPVEDLRLKGDTLLRSVDPVTLRIKRRV